MLIIILIFSFVSAAMFIWPILKYNLAKQKTVLRLKKYVNREEIFEEKRKSHQKDFKAGLRLIAKGVASAKFLESYKKSVQKRLNRAHILLKSEEYITVRILLFFIVGIFGYIITRTTVSVICFGIIGWVFPEFIVKSMTKKRIKQLNTQLGDAIVLISNSLKAGYSFFQAIDIVADEMTGPIAQEFSFLQKEISLGVPTERALENLSSRVLSDDLELVITAVLIQRQVGGNLAEVLDNISSTIRDRVKIKGEIKTITSQGRMSGLIISMLPIVLGLILYIINPEHISILFYHPIGIAILIFSAFMELIGIYFVKKVVNIDV